MNWNMPNESQVACISGGQLPIQCIFLLFSHIQSVSHLGEKRWSFRKIEVQAISIFLAGLQCAQEYGMTCSGIILPCSESIQEDKQKNLFFLVVGLPEAHIFCFILCHQCTEQLIYLRSLTAYIAQRYISAVRYTNVNGTVHPHLFYTSSFHYTINQFFLTLCKTFNTITQFSKIRKSLNLRF